MSRAEVMREVLAILQEDESRSQGQSSGRRMQPTYYNLHQDKGPLPMDGVTLKVGVVIEPPLVMRHNGSNTTVPSVTTDDMYGGESWFSLLARLGQQHCPQMQRRRSSSNSHRSGSSSNEGGGGVSSSKSSKKMGRVVVVVVFVVL